MKLVVLLSGGLDSSTLLYDLAQEHELIALNLDYGQRHYRERWAATKIALDKQTPLFKASLPDHLFYGSALTRGGPEIPEGHYTDENMAVTVVPNRNAVLLACAFALCESNKFDGVAIAAHAGDHPVYPDCRPEFFEAFMNMQALALGHPIALMTSYADLTKAQIVGRGFSLGVPFEDTWSCYKGGDIHCGRCATCVERAEAFSIANVEDKTRYSDPDYWKEVVARQPQSPANPAVPSGGGPGSDDGPSL